MPIRARSPEPQTFDQLVRSKKHRFFKLQYLADQLNDLPRYRERSLDAKEETARNWNVELTNSWGLIEEILSLTSLRKQTDRFTSEARSNPVFQQVRMKNVTKNNSQSLQPVPSFALPTTVRGQALDALWEGYFHDQGWERLKRCAVCHIWFVDQTDNRRKDRCSSACTTVWWSRSRRIQAGHKLKR